MTFKFLGRNRARRRLPTKPADPLLFVSLDSARNVVPVIESGETDDNWAIVIHRGGKIISRQATYRRSAFMRRPCVRPGADLPMRRPMPTVSQGRTGPFTKHRPSDGLSDTLRDGGAHHPRCHVIARLRSS